jgi:hypothetical protein
MKNLITIWSDADYCEPVATQMSDRLKRLGMRVAVCYCQRGLSNFGNNGKDIALAIIFTDAPADTGPIKVLRAISETVEFNKGLPILLVKWSPISGSYLNIHGTFSLNQSDEELRTEIMRACGTGLEEKTHRSLY